MSKPKITFGATEAIRKALKAGGAGGLDKNDLALRTGMPVRIVLPIVSKLCTYGGAVALGTRKSRKYAYAEVGPKKEATESETTTAGRREKIFERPLKRDPFALMKLAMGTRR